MSLACSRVGLQQRDQKHKSQVWRRPAGAAFYTRAQPVLIERDGGCEGQPDSAGWSLPFPTISSGSNRMKMRMMVTNVLLLPTRTRVVALFSPPHGTSASAGAILTALGCSAAQPIISKHIKARARSSPHPVRSRACSWRSFSSATLELCRCSPGSPGSFQAHHLPGSQAPCGCERPGGWGLPAG